MNVRRPTVLQRVALGVVLALLVVYTVFPFYWIVATSLTGQNRLGSLPVTYLPLPPSGEAYAQVFRNPIFVKSFVNSILVAAGATGLALLVGTLGAYAFARFEFTGRRVMLHALLAMTMFPQLAVVGSLFQMVTAAGLYNTRLALVFSYLLLTLPFTVWVLTSTFQSIPAELEEAAYVDGAGPIQTLWMILLPLAMPAMVTTGLIVMISAWNEYLFALSFTADEAARTVPVVVAQFSGESRYEIPWPQIMAGGILATAPLLMIVYFFQRRIVSGMTSGALKG